MKRGPLLQDRAIFFTHLLFKWGLVYLKGRAPVMSHLLIDKVVKTQIERNPSSIKVENEMLEEAKDLYVQGKIPFFEVTKVS